MPKRINKMQFDLNKNKIFYPIVVYFRDYDMQYWWLSSQSSYYLKTLKNIAQCQFPAQSSDLLVNDRYSSLRFNEEPKQPIKDVLCALS